MAINATTKQLPTRSLRRALSRPSIINPRLSHAARCGSGLPQVSLLCPPQKSGGCGWKSSRNATHVLTFVTFHGVMGEVGGFSLHHNYADCGKSWMAPSNFPCRARGAQYECCNEQQCVRVRLSCVKCKPRLTG